MHAAIESMLGKYHCQSQQDYINALKEIFQEIALLGLWRAKFFEKAAFYGGTALRIFYGLDRFSEDLDFSLLNVDKDFSLQPYNQAIAAELKAFGFDVEVVTKIKNIETNIESAFLKANTKNQLLVINVASNIHRMDTIKIKMEVDTQPPGSFKTEAHTLLLPIPFSTIVFSKPDLFAGKIHALLLRGWQGRVKGRDWYDFIWYISRNIPVNLTHLKERLTQSQAWDLKDKLQSQNVINMLEEKISIINFAQAKEDIKPFIKDTQSLDLWSGDFFKKLLPQLTFINDSD